MRGQTNHSLVISPLVDAASMTHFAVDNLRYHNHEVAVSWDPEGRVYKPRPAGGGSGRPCQGLCVYVDGLLRGQSRALGAPLRIDLPY